MAKKVKSQKKQNQKKQQKNKLRQTRLKQQVQASKMTKNEKIGDQVDYAMECLQEDDIREAEKTLTKLSKKHPNNPDVLFGFGMLAVKDDDNDQAIHLFSLVIQNKPDFSEAYFNLGVCFKDKCDFAAMVLAFREVIKFEESDSPIAIKAQEVIDEIAQSIRKDNNLTLDEYIAGQKCFDKTMLAFEDERWHEAIEGFNASLEIYPKHVQSHGNLGLCYAALGQKSTALEYLQKALKLDPDYEVATKNMAIIQSLEEGEALPDMGNIINYYRDYRA
ncbi:MAG: hypothetical protein COA42_22545 [Alteromonadaceae bacterium]|nr:MAG: hypothetical protein COA42_22545 [Alteromonadaceae bacterium]